MDFEDPVAVGRYVVLERLGAGAMGVVYLCQDPLLKRRVAVKIVQKTRSDSETMVARFQRESEISAQLNHPNIITVFDVGEDPAVGPFLTMEFVDGCSLNKKIEEGGLDPATVLDWLTQMGQALVAAERGGVVHRDIKPENILVSKDSQLKLTDFGLARDDDSSLTHTGTMMGTPTHTAPELLGGDRATPATDRWAFSVMAFQMVLGKLPHPGETLSSVLNHIAHEQPAIPEGTPGPLARVFLKALHKDPTRRYDSVLAFLTALSEALGLKDKLVTKGLSVEGAGSSSPSPKVSGPTETEAFPLPAPKPKPTPAAAAAPVKAGARLTGPPAALLKGAEAPAEVATASAPHSGSSRPAISRSSTPQGIALGGYASKSQPKGWTPILTPVRTGQTGNWVWVVVLALGAAGYFFYPRTLAIRTNPPKATVLLDGKPLGPTPCESSVMFGAHMLEVRLDGYDTVVREVRSSESPIDLTLLPALGWVDVVTVPPGATLVLGGRTVGISPFKGLTLPDNPLPLVVTLHGYRKWEGVLGPGRKPPMPIRLKKD